MKTLLIPTLVLFCTIASAQKHEKYCPFGPKDTVFCWYDSAGIRAKGYAIVRQNLCNLPNDSVYHDNQLKNLGLWVYAVCEDRLARKKVQGVIAYASKN
jgi:hypothetical protein